MDLGRPILKEGILDLLFNSVVAVADKVGNAAVNFADGVGNGITGAIDAGFERITSVSLGASHGAPEASPAVALVRAPEIAPPHSANHVDMAELGTFAPQFNNIGQQRGGVGFSMNA